MKMWTVLDPLWNQDRYVSPFQQWFVVTGSLNAATYYCNIFNQDSVFPASLLGYHINQCQKLLVFTVAPPSILLVTLL